MTPDLASAFPAAAARALGLMDVPLLCATEIPCRTRWSGWSGCSPTSRVDSRAREFQHVYLRGAARCARTWRARRDGGATARGHRDGAGRRSRADVDAVVDRVEAAGGEAFVSRGVTRTIIGLVGDVEQFAAR